MITKVKKFTLKQIVDIKNFGIRELLRKFNLLIKILLKIPVDTIAIIPCVIIRLISPLITIRIARVKTTNYGDFAGMPAAYYVKKKKKIDQPKNKYIDLLYIHHEDKVSNKQLEKMWKRKFNFYSSHILDPINRVGQYLPGWKIHRIEVLCNRLESMANYFVENWQPLEFTPKEEIDGKKILNKFGFKDGDKFVCLAVRDGAYQRNKISPRFRDWSYHDFRNYNINNFLLAAEELTKRGYFVFRMGSIVEKSFSSKNPKIIDYANSDLRSDFMDVYLGAKCSFCISTGLGFDDVPYIFKRPVALIACPIGDLTPYRVYNENFLFLSKHHVLKKEKRRLSLSEIFLYGLVTTFETKGFEKKGIKLEENSPEEIKNLALEMVDYLEFNKKLNPKDEELQKTFKNLYAAMIKRAVNNGDKDIILRHISYTKIPGKIRCRFSSQFLRENNNWLK